MRGHKDRQRRETLRVHLARKLNVLTTADRQKYPNPCFKISLWALHLALKSISWKTAEKILWIVIQLKSFVLQLHIEFSCLCFSDAAHHRVGLHWCKDVLVACIVSDKSSKRDSQEKPAQLNQTKIHFFWTENLGLRLKTSWSSSILRKHYEWFSSRLILSEVHRTSPVGR